MNIQLKLFVSLLVIVAAVAIFFQSVTLLNAPSDGWLVLGVVSLLLDGLISYWILQLIWKKRKNKTNESIELSGK